MYKGSKDGIRVLPDSLIRQLLSYPQLGYYLGIAAVLMAWVVWDCLFEPDYNDPVFRDEWRASVFLQPAFPVSPS